MTSSEALAEGQSRRWLWLRIAAYNLAFIAVVFSVSRRLSSSDLDAVRDVDNLGSLLLGCCWFIAFYAFASSAWLSVVRLYDAEAPARVRAGFFAAQPFKYLPTSVFSFSARVKYSTDAGLDLRPAVRAVLFDAVLFIGSGIVVWLAVTGGWVQGTVVGGVVVAAGWGILRLWDRVRRVPLLGRAMPTTVPSGLEISKIVALLGCTWLSSGFSLFLVAQAYDVPSATFGVADAISSNAISYAASIAAVFAPAGLGVREAFLLEADLPASVVVSWRVVSTVIDAVVGIVALVLFARWRKRVDVSSG